MKQHYDLDYLRRTTQVLESFKANTYAPFLNIPSGKIADIGCGAGDDVLRLASLLADRDVALIGLDSQAEMITAAKEKSLSAPQVSFLQGDAEQLPFADGELSGLRHERLIQHLANPGQAFSEFYRVLQPGSPIVNAETDWTSLSFYCGDYGMITKVRDFFRSHNVKQGGAAVSLLQDVAAVGFQNMQVELFPMVSYSLAECMALTRLGDVLSRMLVESRITGEEKDSFLSALEAAEAAGHFVCSLNLIIVKAVK